MPKPILHNALLYRLLELAREGSQMTAQRLRDLEPDRRYPTLVAVLETKATIIDQIVDLANSELKAQPAEADPLRRIAGACARSNTKAQRFEHESH